MTPKYWAAGRWYWGTRWLKREASSSLFINGLGEDWDPLKSPPGAGCRARTAIPRVGANYEDPAGNNDKMSGRIFYWNASLFTT